MMASASGSSTSRPLTPYRDNDGGSQQHHLDSVDEKEHSEFGGLPSTSSGINSPLLSASQSANSSGAFQQVHLKRPRSLRARVLVALLVLVILYAVWAVRNGVESAYRPIAGHFGVGSAYSMVYQPELARYHAALDAVGTHKEAITTLLTNDKFMPQLAAVSYGLDKFSPGRDRIILIPEYRAKNASLFGPTAFAIMQRLGWQIMLCDHIPVPPKNGKNTPEIYVDQMNKLYVWNMTQYQAVLQVDLDMLVLGNIDEPFRLLVQSEYSIAAVHDHAKLNTHGTLDARASLNGGAMWIKPNTTVFHDIYAFSRDTSNYDNAFAEQSMLISYYWLTWLALRSEYNLITEYTLAGEGAARHAHWRAVRPNARMMHFAGGIKPWSPHAWNEKGLYKEEVINWRNAVREAVTHYNLTVEDLRQGHAVGAIGWDIKDILNQALP